MGKELRREREKKEGMKKKRKGKRGIKMKRE